MIKVGLIGLGRTGSSVASGLLSNPEMSLVMALARPGSAKVGKDLGDILGTKPTGLIVKGSNRLDSELLQTNPDVIVDFTNPEAGLKNLRIVALHGIPIIIGTTGFNHEQLQSIQLMAQQFKTTVVYAPNLSLGINVLLNLVLKAAEFLADWDVEIIETHHRHKKDAPSGTALKIARELGAYLDLPEDHIAFGHERTAPRKNNTIGVHAIRGGGVTGIHQVVFLSENEKLEIKHESHNRANFVDCLFRVIKWIISARPGYYTVEEALGLSPSPHHHPKPEHFQIVG
ncbi:MAG: 4-hydroxy-tetrahydrodipicolinate reductase [Syntrophomonadaceae bacterium]|nr:4-hydroxy-tetrahydrodipicolinate reductase [Syntrophomonadaceae bacterium]